MVFVGDVIKKHRVARGLSQYKLAAITGLHPNTLARAEQASAVSPQVAAALAEVFGCRPEDLLPKKRRG